MGSIVMEPDDIASYANIYHPNENHSSICTSVGKIQSRGFFKNSNPFDYSVPLLLAQLSLASLFILFTSRLLKPLGQPSMVIQILGGMALGPSFLGRIAAFTELLYPLHSFIILDTLAMFGYIFYFFLIGVQLDPWIIKKIEKKEIVIGISTIAFAMVLSESAAFILLSGNSLNLDPKLVGSLPVVAVASSVLAFPVIAHYLTELKMVNSQFGRTALSSSLVSNMFGFCVISLTFLSNQLSSGRLKWLQSLVAAIAWTGIALFVVRPVIVWALRRHPDGEPLKQGFIFMVFVGVLVAALGGEAVGLSTFMGPFIYGIAVPAGPPLGSALVEKLEVISSWLFMPLYFVKTGLVTDLFCVPPKNYLVLQSIILISCLGKFLGAVISSTYYKLPLRDAISIGLVMNVQGLIDLAMFKAVKQSKAIHGEAFAVLCISMLIVTASISPILRYIYDPLRRYAGYKMRSVLHLKLNSDLKVVACLYEQVNVPATINLLEALHPNRRSPIDICLVHLVELIGRAHPLLIPHKLTKSYFGDASTSKCIINAFKLFQQNYYAAVNMHSFTSISPYASMHDIVCSTAFERKVSLILVPFHKRFATDNNVEVSKTGVKIVNEKILEMAPCSVAVIVDRGQSKTSRPLLEEWSSYRVAVLFLGGPDDREALAIGARMVGQPNVSLTIVRLLVATDNTSQINLDDEVLSEIRTRLGGNFRATYVEQVVRDGTGTIAVIRSMENLYELIIVGRRHDTQNPILQGLVEWNEEPELGTLGHMLALADFSSDTTILVVQQHISVFDDPSEDKSISGEFSMSRHIKRAAIFRSKDVVVNVRPHTGI